MKKNFLLISLTLILTSSCVSQKIHHGHQVDKENLSKIETNKTSAAEVSQILGSPSLKSNFGEDSWFYVHSTSINRAFFTPKLLSRDVVAISFNKNIVKRIDSFTLKDNNEILIDKTSMSTSGTKANVIQHFINNIGRFNQADQKSSISKPRGIN